MGGCLGKLVGLARSELSFTRGISQMKMCTVVISLLYTLSVIIILYFDHWDHSVYNISSIELLNNGAFNSTTRFSTIVLPGGITALVNSYTKCNNYTLPLTTENSGVWSLCRDVTDKEWSGIGKVCGRMDRCFWYFSDLVKPESFCCNHCCPYAPEIVEDMLINGDTTYVAVYTLVSAMIVSLLLHAASYLQMLISLSTNHVVVTRMTGITFLLSGVFLAFSLVVNHYKISIMNDRSTRIASRSLPMYPLEVGLLRTTSVGWCMLFGWFCIALSAIVATSWIGLSHLLVARLSRVFYQTEQHRNKKVIRKMSIPSAPAATLNNYTQPSKPTKTVKWKEDI